MIRAHRRIAFGDLIEFQRQDYQARRITVDEITRLARDLREA
jgi:hypothetical protein